MTRLRDNQALRDEVHGLLAAHDGTGVIVAGFAARKALRRDTMTRILDAVDRALTATGPGSGMSYSEARSLGHCGALMDDDGTRCTNAAPRGGSDCIKHRHVTGAATGPGSRAAVCPGYPTWERPEYAIHCAGCSHPNSKPAAPQTDHRAAPDTDRHGNTLVPCASCGEVTAYIATETCDPCWERAHPAATPPSGSPPGAAEVATTFYRRAGQEDKCENCGGSFAWHVKRPPMCPTNPPESPDGSRGTR